MCGGGSKYLRAKHFRLGCCFGASREKCMLLGYILGPLGI